MLNNVKYKKRLWFCKSDGQHGGVQFKAFIMTSDNFIFVGSTDENGKLVLNKTESLKGLEFPHGAVSGHCNF